MSSWNYIIVEALFDNEYCDYSCPALRDGDNGYECIYFRDRHGIYPEISPYLYRCKEFIESEKKYKELIENKK